MTKIEYSKLHHRTKFKILRQIIIMRLGYDDELLLSATQVFYYYLEVRQDSNLQLILKNNHLEKGIIFPLDDLQKINARLISLEYQHSRNRQRIKNKSRFKSGTKGLHFLTDKDHLKKLETILKSQNITMREFFNRAIDTSFLTTN